MSASSGTVIERLGDMSVEDFVGMIAKECADKVALRFGLKGERPYISSAEAMKIVGDGSPRTFRRTVAEYPEIQPDGKGSQKYDREVAFKIRKHREAKRTRQAARRKQK